MGGDPTGTRPAPIGAAQHVGSLHAVPQAVARSAEDATTKSSSSRRWFP
jgi:hypothetical protein